jgi:hypothetical protein
MKSKIDFIVKKGELFCPHPLPLLIKSPYPNLSPRGRKEFFKKALSHKGV